MLLSCGEREGQSLSVSPLPGPPPLQVEVSGLVPRYAVAFSEPARIELLSSALVGCVDQPSLEVRYQDGRGQVTLAGRWTGCRPTPQGSMVDLSALQPAAAALARYRDGLAVQVEARLATFELALRLGACRVQLAGQVPPDGTSFGRCVEVLGGSPCPRELGGVLVLASPALVECLDSAR